MRLHIQSDGQLFGTRITNDAGERFHASDVQISIGPHEVNTAIIVIPLVAVDVIAESEFIGRDTQGRKWKLTPLDEPAPDSTPTTMATEGLSNANPH